MSLLESYMLEHWMKRRDECLTVYPYPLEGKFVEILRL